jgi:hypothetical protein
MCFDVFHCLLHLVPIENFYLDERQNLLHLVHIVRFRLHAHFALLFFEEVLSEDHVDRFDELLVWDEIVDVVRIQTFFYEDSL